MRVTTPAERLRQELGLMVEYLDSAKSIDADFLKLHGDLLIGYIREVERESRATQDLAA